MKRIFLAVTAVCFIVIALVGWDPDWGGHLRLGDYILHHGIPTHDPFSCSMPSFAYIDHSWLFDVISITVGKTGMAIGLTAGAMAALALICLARESRIGLIAAMLTASVMATRMGVRPQVIDWAAIAGLWWLLDDRHWKKWRWGVPAMFWLWVNVHGGWAIGGGMWGVAVVLKWWQKRKIDMGDVGVMAATGLAVLINPYGARAIVEVLRTVGDTNLGKWVAEWQPWYSELDMGAWIMLAAIVVWGRKWGKKVELWKWVWLAGTFAAGLMEVRNMVILAVVAGEIFGELGSEWWQGLPKNKTVAERANKFGMILVGVAGIILAIQLVGGVVEAGKISESRFYPGKAIEYLQQHHISGNVFADYSWGEYIMWKWPQVKVFIDGRMPSWRWPVGARVPAGERSYAFGDYIGIMVGGQPIEPTFSECQIKLVILESNGKARSWLFNIENLMASWLGNIQVSQTKPLGERLMDAGWKKIYADEVSVVYMK